MIGENTLVWSLNRMPRGVIAFDAMALGGVVHHNIMMNVTATVPESCS